MRFGGSSAGLLQRLRPTRVGVADLLEVADAVLPALATPRLRLGMVRSTGAGSVVVVEEDERQVRIGLHELADDMTRAGVLPTADGISRALTSWVAHRPVDRCGRGGLRDRRPRLGRSRPHRGGLAGRRPQG